VSFWRRMFAFAGPAYLISVGYMDPGNWATDLEGGARFGYQLIWVLIMVQRHGHPAPDLSARLGIVSGRDLAQACRETYPRLMNFALWVLCEIAVAACDLAEVLGAAIALNLLFHIPLLAGVLITAADTLLVLWFQSVASAPSKPLCWPSSRSWRGVSALKSSGPSRRSPRCSRGWFRGSIATACTWPSESWEPPSCRTICTCTPPGADAHIAHSEAAKRSACRYNLIDSAVALNGAMLVNCAILVLAAAVFFKRGIVVTQIQQAHLLLVPLLGTSAAGVIFAVALLCSGQSSTLTGTMAGQVVMEGFLNFRMRPWLRRLVTAHWPLCRRPSPSTSPATSPLSAC